MKKFNQITHQLYLLMIVAFTSLAGQLTAAPNDTPCNAINLNVTTFCNPSLYDNIGITSTSLVAAPSCGYYAGGDVWFTAIVPANGGLNIVTSSGTMTDGAMAIYTGTCNALTLVDSNDDSYSGLMPEIYAHNLTPGSTVWIRVWSVQNASNGSFDICVTEPPTQRGPTIPPTIANTCATAGCPSNAPYPTPTGIPSMGGGGIYGCVGGTPNPTWTVFQANTSSTITIGVQQSSTGSAPYYDIDFVCWGPFANPAAACAGLSAATIVSCSFSTSGNELCTIASPTVGGFYVLLCTNWNGGSGYELTMPITPSSAAISCACSTTATISPTSVCPSMPFSISCTAVPTATAYNWTGPSGFNATGTSTSSTAPATAGPLTYTVSITTPGYTCSSTATVTVNAKPAITNFPLPATICDGQVAQYTPTIPTPALSTYTWTASCVPAGAVWGFPASGSNLTPINYTLHNSGTASAVVTFTITPQGPGPTNCTGPQVFYQVTVNPKPSINNPPAMAFICSGSSAQYTPTASLAGTTFTYTASASSVNVSGFTPGGAASINDVLVNTGTTPEMVTYVVTPHGIAPSLCAGTPANFVVNVLPTPSPANAGIDENICGDTTLLAGVVPLVGTGTWTAVTSGLITNISQPNSFVSTLNNGANIFQWVVTNAPCPASIDTVVVNVAVSPTISNPIADFTQSICSATATSITPTANVGGSTFNWTATTSSANLLGFTSGNNAAAGTTIADVITNSGTTSDTVKYTITPVGPAPVSCSGPPTDFYVIVDPRPSLTNAVLSQSFCSGDTVSFTPTANITGATFSWTATNASGNISGYNSAPAGTTTAITDILFNTGTATDSVVYSITPAGPAPNTCAGTPVDFIVHVDPSPAITNAVLTQSVCTGGTVSITPQFNVTGATFTWTATSALGTSNGFTASGSGPNPIAEVVNNTGTVTDTIRYILTPASPLLACIGTNTTFIAIVDPIPTITNVNLHQIVCSGTAGSISPTSNVTGASFSYTATSSSANLTGFTASGTIASGGSLAEVINNSGSTIDSVTYSITAIGPAPLLCPAANSTPFVVVVNPNPALSNPVASFTQSLCSGNTATFTPTSNATGTTFQWNVTASAGCTGYTNAPAGTSTPISDLLTNSGTTLGTVTYSITPTGPAPASCVGTSQNFVVNLAPIPAINNAVVNQTICSGATATITPTSSVANTLFSWTATSTSVNLTGFTASGSFIAGGSINDVINNSGTSSEVVTYIITSTGAAPTSCASDTVHFKVFVNPIPAAPTVAPLSYCPNAVAPALTAVGSNLLWYTVAVGGVSSNIAPVPSTATSGTFHYYVSQTVNGCESQRADLVVTIYAPTAAPTGSSPIVYCLNSAPAVLTATGTSLLWYTVPVGGVSSINAPTPVTTTAGTTSYYVTQTLNGCESTRLQIDVIVHALPTATVGGGGQTCFGDPTASVSITLIGSAPWNITYSNGVANTSVVALASPYVIANPAQGNYTVISVSDANCTGTSSLSALVSVLPLPTVAFTPDVFSGCIPVCVNFTDLSSIPVGSIAGWSWNFGDGSTSTSQNGQHCYSSAANYSVSLTVTSLAGCPNTLLSTNLINVVSLPDASFSIPSNISILNPTVTFSDYSSHAISWAWDFGDQFNPTTNTSTVQNPTHTYSATGHYCVTLVVSSAGSCFDTTRIYLDVLPEYSMYIPNAFSPNHDGINDEFYCKGTNIVDFEMYIYDRWGNFVFYTNTMDKHWDGSVNGTSVAQEDVYVYIIKVKDNMKENHEYIGNITLVK